MHPPPPSLPLPPAIPSSPLPPPPARIDVNFLCRHCDRPVPHCRSTPRRVMKLSDEEFRPVLEPTESSVGLVFCLSPTFGLDTQPFRPSSRRPIQSFCSPQSSPYLRSFPRTLPFSAGAPLPFVSRNLQNYPLCLRTVAPMSLGIFLDKHVGVG